MNFPEFLVSLLLGVTTGGTHQTLLGSHEGRK